MTYKEIADKMFLSPPHDRWIPRCIVWKTEFKDKNRIDNVCNKKWNSPGL